MPKLVRRLLPVVLFASTLVSRPAADREPSGPTALPKLTAAAASGLRFEENRGQLDPAVRYVSRAGRAVVFLTDEGAKLRFGGQAGGTELTMRVAGGRRVTPKGTELAAAKTNYFTGARALTDVPSYGRVVYEGVREGVDLVFRGDEGTLEYDFLVKPGASTEGVAMEVSGAEGLSIGDAGELRIATTKGTLIEPRPHVFQRNDDGTLRDVPTSYRIVAKDRVGFEVAAYDHSRELVIDPAITYSTYVGANNDDRARAVAVDGAGAMYVVGSTMSTSFGTMNPVQATFGGATDVFVAKIAAAGNTLVYATYLGGTDVDDVASIAVDAAGAAYIGGQTSSADFPVTAGALQTVYGGVRDGFVAKLAPAGNALTYATYLGGASTDRVESLVVDGTGNVYVGGSTNSANFPTANAYDSTYAGGFDAFLAKIAPAGNAFVYSTYFGMSGPDEGLAVGIDGTGAAYLAGATFSTTLPLANAFQTTIAGGEEAFVTKFTAAGNALVHSSFLGGTANDRIQSMHVSTAGVVTVAGVTRSLDFPTRNPVQATHGGGTTDAFVTRVAAAGGSLVYSTYLGGGANDDGRAVTADADGYAYVTGITESATYPVLRAIVGHDTYKGGIDAFLSKLTPTGSAFAYSTFIGGNREESGRGIAVDAARTAYVVGFTNSFDFPRLDPLQNTLGGEPFDGTLTKVTSPAVAIAPVTVTVPPRGAQTFTGSLGTAGYTFAMRASPSGGTVVAATGAYTAGPTPNVTDTVVVTDVEGMSAVATVTVGAGVSVTPQAPRVAPRGSVTFAATGGSGTGFMYTVSSNLSGATIVPATGVYTAGSTPATDVVTVSDSLGNLATSTVTVGVDAADAGPDAASDASAGDGSADAASPLPSDSGAVTGDSGAQADAGLAPIDEGGDSGCGCKTTSAPVAGGASWLAIAGLAAFVARRRMKRAG